MPTSNFNVDDLLNGLFSEEAETLDELFDKRVKELGIAPTNALEIMDIEYRALQGILNGTSPRVDARNFIKISNFLKIPKNRVIELFYKALEVNFPDLKEFPKEKIDFINKNFDLAVLKRIGFIKDLSDYKHIEARINEFFGFKTIFEYKLPGLEVAFSAGVRQAKSIVSKGFWVKSAIDTFSELDNPYDYDKENLKKYIPQIRWQSTNVDKGLTNVIKDLFRLGVTILYQTSIPSLHLKGATMLVNDKPCIVLTDYMGFYTTLWHTLCHELCHVLFDLEEIKKSRYHISEDSDELPIQEKEKIADHFAREYLFSKDKLQQVKPHINNKKFVTEFAFRHEVHESFIYTYYAYEYSHIDPKAWAKAKGQNPVFDDMLTKIENPWNEIKSISKHIKFLKGNGVYN